MKRPFALILCAFSPALAHAQPAPARWDEALREARKHTAVPAFVQEQLAGQCGKVVPDSVALVTPLPERLGNGSIWVLAGRHDNGWKMASEPSGADTLRAKLLGVVCKPAMFSGMPPAIDILVESAGRIVRYTPDPSPVCERFGCNNYARVHVIGPRGLEEASWDRTAGRLAAASAINADRITKMRGYGWSVEQVQAIIAKRVLPGMTGLMVHEAMGPPDRVNRVQSAAGTSEQWVYGSRYVYLENDRVTAIQN